MTIAKYEKKLHPISVKRVKELFADMVERVAIMDNLCDEDKEWFECPENLVEGRIYSICNPLFGNYHSVWVKSHRLWYHYEYQGGKGR